MGERPLESPVILGFRIPSRVSVNLAPDHFSLYKLKNGQNAGSLGSDQIDKLERGYLGRNVKLMVFEEGEFTGVPNGLEPEDMWAGAGFHFSTHLTILKDLNSNNLLSGTSSHSVFWIATIFVCAITIAWFYLVRRPKNVATEGIDEPNAVGTISNQ